MPKYEVKYQVFKDTKKQQPVTTADTRMTVDAPNPNVAQTMVESMNGGSALCRTFGARQV